MNKSLWLKVFIAVTAVGALAIVLLYRTPERIIFTVSPPLAPVKAVDDSKTSVANADASSASAAPQDELLHSADASANPDVVLLNSGNFESFVLKCFKGEKCRFGEDPMKMYQEFKASGNNRAIDNLLSFMRSALRYPAFRDYYKDTLKAMINDFYPPEERQFQEAAYYSYLGESEKSLNMYLDLVKKSKSNPDLQVPSSLNIANIYYDLKKYPEALNYYQSALEEHLSGKIVATPSPVEFIEERIFEIKTKRL
jgi:Tetratricopeptide repeat.